MVRRKGLKAAVALMLGFGGVFAAVQPASAAVVVPAGESGSACSGYTYINSARTLYFQTCAWASWNPPNSRIWFTVHFGNSSGTDAKIDKTEIGYHISGSARQGCINQYSIEVPAHSVKASVDKCWFNREQAAVQASAIVHEGSYTSPAVLSPTLQVQGVG
jgi:hypothetical protein